MSVLARANAVREHITKLEGDLTGLRKEMERIERQCRHQWGESVYTPEHREAYTIPGDPPGTMGVDWRPACHVPAKTIKRWTRTCKLCGKSETTDRTRTEKVEHPSF